jgi:hypothetical protein
VSEKVVGRPGQIRDVGDEIRLDPMNAREHERRSETRLARCQHAKGWRLAGERVQTMPLGALLLGHYTDDGKLVYAGRVGTGMSDKVLADLRRHLEPLSRAKSPLKIPPPRKTRFGSPLGLSRVHWVEPKLVAEITYLTWTAGQPPPPHGLCRAARGQAGRSSAGDCAQRITLASRESLVTLVRARNRL